MSFMSREVTTEATAKLQGTAASILETKGRDVHSIAPDESVYAAVKKLKEHHIGALVVIDQDALVGVISERDYARKIILEGVSSKETLVREIMSAPVITVAPTDTLPQCVRLMSERRIRHLPVVDRGRVVGMISTGDLMRAYIIQQEQTIGQLNTLISDPYPA
jgi:CBS domain-containing protein